MYRYLLEVKLPHVVKHESGCSAQFNKITKVLTLTLPVVQPTFQPSPVTTPTPEPIEPQLQQRSSPVPNNDNIEPEAILPSISKQPFRIFQCALCKKLPGPSSLMVPRDIFVDDSSKPSCFYHQTNETVTICLEWKDAECVEPNVTMPDSTHILVKCKLLSASNGLPLALMVTLAENLAPDAIIAVNLVDSRDSSISSLVVVLKKLKSGLWESSSTVSAIEVIKEKEPDAQPTSSISTTNFALSTNLCEQLE